MYFGPDQREQTEGLSWCENALTHNTQHGLNNTAQYHTTPATLAHITRQYYTTPHCAVQYSTSRARLCPDYDTCSTCYTTSTSIYPAVFLDEAVMSEQWACPAEHHAVCAVPEDRVQLQLLHHRLDYRGYGPLPTSCAASCFRKSSPCLPHFRQQHPVDARGSALPLIPPPPLLSSSRNPQRGGCVSTVWKTWTRPCSS